MGVCESGNAWLGTWEAGAWLGALSNLVPDKRLLFYLSFIIKVIYVLIISFSFPLIYVSKITGNYKHPKPTTTNCQNVYTYKTLFDKISVKEYISATWPNKRFLVATTLSRLMGMKTIQ